MIHCIGDGVCSGPQLLRCGAELFPHRKLKGYFGEKTARVHGKYEAIMDDSTETLRYHLTDPGKEVVQEVMELYPHTFDALVEDMAQKCTQIIQESDVDNEKPKRGNKRMQTVIDVTNDDEPMQSASLKKRLLRRSVISPRSALRGSSVPCTIPTENMSLYKPPEPDDEYACSMAMAPDAVSGAPGTPGQVSQMMTACEQLCALSTSPGNPKSFQSLGAHNMMGIETSAPIIDHSRTNSLSKAPRLPSVPLKDVSFVNATIVDETGDSETRTVLDSNVDEKVKPPQNGVYAESKMQQHADKLGDLEAVCPGLRSDDQERAKKLVQSLQQILNTACCQDVTFDELQYNVLQTAQQSTIVNTQTHVESLEGYFADLKTHLKSMQNVAKKIPSGHTLDTVNFMMSIRFLSDAYLKACDEFVFKALEALQIANVGTAAGASASTSVPGMHSESLD